MTMKTCSKCHKNLPLSEFYRRPSRKNGEGVQSSCKQCAKAEHRAWRHKNLEHVKEAQRRWRESQPPGWKIERRHGFVPLDGPCDICQSIGPRVVDHDHVCCPDGRSCEKCRRGLLCGACNKALGFFNDDTMTLFRAIRYLQKPPGVINGNDCRSGT